MNATRDFIVRELLRARMPSLDLALLTQRGMRFVLARISFVYARALVRTMVHAAELWFITREFPLEFAVPLFTMRALFGTIASLWWGPLEAVRRRVHDELYQRQPRRARSVIEAWAGIALGLGALVCAYGTHVVTSAETMVWWYDGLYGSYLLVSAFTLTVDLWSRAIHAGAYALGRVYRTRWSMILPDLLEVALIIGLWRSLGPFALAAAVLVTSLLRSGLTLYYTRRAYDIRKLLWPRFPRAASLAQLDRSDLRVAARGLLGILPTQLDRVLLISLLVARTGPDLMPLAAPYYALRPIAGAAQGWARTYYVDLIRMDSLASTLFRARLQRLLHAMSALVGAAVGVTLIAGSVLLFGMAGIEAAAWFVPLSILRSHFAVLQIRAIAYARTDALAALSLAMVPIVAATFYVDATDRTLVAWVTGALLLVALLGAYVEARERDRGQARGRRLPLSAWLSILGRQPGPIRLHAACITRNLARPSVVLHQLHTSAATQHTTRLGSSWVLWWEDGRAPLAHGDLVALLSGTCRTHAYCDGSSGLDALRKAHGAGILPAPLSNALSATREGDSQPELRAHFAREIPAGYVVDAKSASPALAQLPPGDLAQVRRALLAGAREQHHVPRRAPFQVAVYAPHGEPSLVFVWPAQTPRTREFHNRVVHAAWRDSLPVALELPPEAVDPGSVSR